MNIEIDFKDLKVLYKSIFNIIYLKLFSILFLSFLNSLVIKVLAESNNENDENDFNDNENGNGGNDDDFDDDTEDDEYSEDENEDEEKIDYNSNPFSKEFELWNTSDLIEFADYHLLFENLNLFETYSKEKMIKWIRKACSNDEVDIEMCIDLRNYKHWELQDICQKLGIRDFLKLSTYDMACDIAAWKPHGDYDVIYFLTFNELKKICLHNKIFGFEKLNYDEIHKLLWKQDELNFDCVTEDGFFEIPWFDNDGKTCKNLLIKWWNK